MLVQTISQYLGSHKRLVVPQLGTFIVKEPGVSIVFSELLKRDDGVLRGLLREAGVGELEAAGEIDRFVFEVRHAAQHGQEFRLDGFGVLRPGPNGTDRLRLRAAACAVRADAAPGCRLGSGRDAARTCGANHPRNALFRAARVALGQDEPRPFGAGPALRQAAEDYRRPTPMVDRPPRRRRADRFIWVAAIAAAIAVAAIAFGYLREANDKEAEMQYLEQPADPQPATDTGAATPEQPITE